MQRLADDCRQILQVGLLALVPRQPRTLVAKCARTDGDVDGVASIVGHGLVARAGAVVSFTNGARSDNVNATRRDRFGASRQS